LIKIYFRIISRELKTSDKISIEIKEHSGDTKERSGEIKEHSGDTKERSASDPSITYPFLDGIVAVNFARKNDLFKSFVYLQYSV
jgi:hypothetical protein